MHDQTEYVVHIQNFKHALNDGLVQKKVWRLNKFNQNAWVKPYSDINAGLRKKAKNYLERISFKLKNNAKFGKTLENVSKQRDIKVVTTERRNYFVLEPNYHTAKFSTENLLAIEDEKEEILQNKSVNLVLSILEWSKILMFEFWYDYLKPVFGEKVKLCYMDIDSFSVYIKTCYINKDVAEDVEIRFDTSTW